jgi:DNA-binding LacI/PurR family transcriptional regulator
VDALKENNIELSEKLTGKSDFSVRGGNVATHRLLGNSKPAAIITVDDLMAHGSSDRQDWKPGESDKKYCF